VSPSSRPVVALDSLVDVVEIVSFEDMEGVATRLVIAFVEGKRLSPPTFVESGEGELVGANMLASPPELAVAVIEAARLPRPTFPRVANFYLAPEAGMFQSYGREGAGYKHRRLRSLICE
jgi:hypothetical protein